MTGKDRPAPAEDPRMRLTLEDCHVPTPASEARRAVLEARRAAWARRCDEARAAGVTPRLMDMDDLAREAAGLPLDPPAEAAAVPTETPASLTPARAAPTPAILLSSEQIAPRAEAQAKGYTGNSCASCGGFAMRRSGTCETCESCGTASGGCS